MSPYGAPSLLLGKVLLCPSTQWRCRVCLRDYISPVLHLAFSILLHTLGEDLTKRNGSWVHINMPPGHLKISVPHASSHMAAKRFLAVHLVSPYSILRWSNVLVMLGWKQSRDILLLGMDCLALRFSSFKFFCIFSSLPGFKVPYCSLLDLYLV